MMSGQMVPVMHLAKPLSIPSAANPILIAAARQVAPLSLLNALRAAPQGLQRIFWQHADQPVAFAGFGVAAEIVAYGRDRFSSIRQQSTYLFENAILDMPPVAQPRLIGGFAFRDDFSAASGVWSAFPSAYFLLPRVQITQSNDQTWLTVSAYLDQTANLDDEWDQLQLEIDDLEARLRSVSSWVVSAKPRPMHIEDSLPCQVWHEQILKATRRIQAGELKKVVLSRFKDILFDAPVDPIRALERLTQSYPQAYRFLIEVYPGHAFFGATPELLVSKTGKSICTAALAGSRPRGKTSAEDQALAIEMFESAKERVEHQVVVDTLDQLLSPFVDRLHYAAQPEVMQLPNIQHLYTPMTGTLLPNVTLLDVAGAFHPTPALGGYPRSIAFDAIRRIESADRGWYAAPVGWIGADGDGTFAVAIRSAVSVGHHARLYAGAGIVADSDPDKEWDETALKFKPLLNALEIEDRVRAEP